MSCLEYTKGSVPLCALCVPDHSVAGAALFMFAIEIELAAAERVANLLGAVAAECCLAIALLQDFEYLGGGIPLSFAAVLRLAEEVGNHLCQGVDALETFVLADECCDFFVGQPVALAIADFLLELGIELVVVHVVAEADKVCYLHADKAS